MKARIAPFVICVLLAALLSVLPAAIYVDLATPMGKWENWYWPGQPAPRPQFNVTDKLPLFLRGEFVVFKLLVVPPAHVRDILTGWPGNYGLAFVHPGSSGEAPASLPPAALALEHIRFALPFWFVVAVLVYEAFALILRRSRVVAVA